MFPSRRISLKTTVASTLCCILLFCFLVLPRKKLCPNEEPMSYRELFKRSGIWDEPFLGFKYPPNTSPSTNIDWNTVKASSLTGPQIIDYFLWTNQSSCLLSHDFGGRVAFNPSGIDGQKAVCLDPQVAPKPGECIVYSFGINNDWSFDETMERYGCEVYAFDPSMDMDDHDHSEGIHFYNLGLGQKNEIEEGSNWKKMTLLDIYKKLSHAHEKNKYIDYLKMDIELDEWGVLIDILDSGMLSKIRQLAVEVHLLADEGLQIYRKSARIVQKIEREGNMTRFDSKYNPWGMMKFKEFDMYAAACYEIAWFNNNLQRSISFPPR